MFVLLAGHVCVGGWSCLCWSLVMSVLMAGHVRVGRWSHTCVGGHMLLATPVKIGSNPPVVCLVLYSSVCSQS